MILRGFAERSLGRTVLELVLYFHPEMLLQDFIATLAQIVEYETCIKNIFLLHQQKKYREFWKKFHELADTPALHHLQAVGAKIEHKSLLPTMAFIAGHEMTDADIEPYKTHRWSDRLRELPLVEQKIRELLA